MLQTETAIHPHGEENNPKDRPSPARGTGVVHRLRRLYVTASILLMNVLIWGILLNLAAYMVLELSAKGDVSSNPLVNRYAAAADRAFPLIYPTLSRPEIDKLLEEMWSRPVAFHPFTLFKERPYRGKYVNVHPAGFRYSENQGPWPPSQDKINIFFFGGSTAFGYGPLIRSPFHRNYKGFRTPSSNPIASACTILEQILSALRRRELISQLFSPKVTSPVLPYSSTD
jgi:hypothetical protein